ncbi:MAG: carbon starvation protein A [Paramuribaculum sp.]|nr:carbon starvation protein A [Paramuribaculum sp.]
MTSFLLALAVLIGGYFIYGSIVERIAGIDPQRKMPSETMRDNVDYMPMPAWKVFLIQFLNIAGLGPIFGAIMGVMFGPAAFIWITLGTIFAGATHDFISGYVSIRRGGASLPEIVGHELGNGIKRTMMVFSVLLLVLVGCVFILTPAQIIDSLTPAWLSMPVWIGAIFIYYILATLLPVDKVIGKLYPLFGFALLFMAAGILGVMIFSTDIIIPLDFTDGLSNRYADPSTHPIFPMMFVSIACGAISGFHATQSPMMARCLTNEKLARPIFYGAMVAEGIVALIWAAAAIAFTGGYGELSEYFTTHGGGAGTLVKDISVSWLGVFGGFLALLGVVAAPITSGDTALRSARLIIADAFNIDQKGIVKRLMITIPLFMAVIGFMLIDFNILWRYFAWCNQALSVFTLWAVTVYLARHRRFYFITLIPAMFMTMVCGTYLLSAARPEGFGLDMSIALAISTLVTASFLVRFSFYLRKIRSIEPSLN